MSPYSSSREQQRQAIDAEIKSSKSSIEVLNLKHRRNVLAPISSLPAEIIAAIFSYLRLPPPDPSLLSSLPSHLVAGLFPSFPGILSRGRWPGHRTKDWLCATHVCHQWREIALNDPLFWNHVDFTNLTLAGAAEVLTRAKKMPLYLEARGTRRFWKDDARRGAFENELQARVSRICHLRIRAETFHLDCIINRLASPASILEYLSLSNDVATSFFCSSLSVPDTLFDGTAPRLSRIELRGVDISWNSPLMKGLRYLEIHKLSNHVRPSLAVWLDALNKMPSLESLVLCSASPIAPPFPFDVERAVVTLSSLTHLDISASAGDCAFALAHLALPALKKLCLAAEYFDMNGEDVQNLFRYVAPHAGGPQDTQPLQSAFVHRKEWVTIVLAWPVPDMDINLNLDDPSAFVFTALSARVAIFITNNAAISSPDQQQIINTAILNTLMLALPLDGLVKLNVRHYTDLDAQFWHRHASKWPLLRRVQLTPPEARGFREMLSQGNGSCEYPLLPSLTELVLVDVLLSEHRTLRLCDALMARVEQGVPLEALDLGTCEATSDAIDLLREIVLNVWEPIEITRISPVPSRSGRSFVHDNSSGEEDFSDDSYDIEEGQESEDYSDMGGEYSSYTNYQEAWE